jgi:transcriptional regulator with XRE-family HTH domain
MDIYNFSEIENTTQFMKLVITEFGNRIKRIRMSKQLTQERAAELAGVNPKYWGEIGRSEKCPTAFVVFKIATALQVPVCKILTDGGCPYNNILLIERFIKVISGRGEKDMNKAIRLLELFFE